ILPGAPICLSIGPFARGCSQHVESASRRRDRKPMRKATLGQPIRTPERYPSIAADRSCARLQVDPKQTVHVNPLASGPPHLTRGLRVSRSLQLFDIRQRITTLVRQAQGSNTFAVLAYAPEPHAIASDSVAVGPETISHGRGFLDDGRSRRQG